MKKVMNIAKILFVINIASLMLTACGSPKVSEDHLRYGQKALSIVDSYLKFEINAKEASQQMMDLYLRSHDLPDEAGTENFEGDRIIENSVPTMRLYLSDLSLDIREDNLQNLKIERNKLAEAIGEDQIEVSQTDSSS